MSINNNTINYDTDRPTYGYTSSTSSEFHDELIRRKIVTPIQAMMAKGMSEVVAVSVLEEHDAIVRQQQQPWNKFSPTGAEDDDDDDDDENDDNDDDDDDYDDDEFMQQYRQSRFEELLHQDHSSRSSSSRPAIDRTSGSGSSSSTVRYIDRTQWLKEVNEASFAKWVVVYLVSSDSERTGFLQDYIQEYLVHRFDSDDVTFIFIDYNSAIPNYPLSNLPTLFAYRHGVKQHELIRYTTMVEDDSVNGTRMIHHHHDIHDTNSSTFLSKDNLRRRRQNNHHCDDDDDEDKESVLDSTGVDTSTTSNNLNRKYINHPLENILRQQWKIVESE
jgi:hypothetical protein